MPLKLCYVGFSGDPGFPSSDVLSKFFQRAKDATQLHLNPSFPEQQGNKVSEQQGNKVSEQQGNKVSEQQGNKVSEQQENFVLEQQGNKVSEATNDSVTSNPVEANVLIIGSFINPTEFNIIAGFRGIRVLYIAEPITKLRFCTAAGYLYTNDLCDYYIGCISNGPKSVKYPFYAQKSIDFLSANNYVRDCSLSEKQFCTLINRHDWGYTRTPIYNMLRNVGPIVCPGALYNNCSNEELNRIGNKAFIKKFLFNICSENFGTSHPGYITEKLQNCVEGGAIPVYYGALDEIDELVFNKKRILFVNESNVGDVAVQVMELVQKSELLNAFYRQPVFMETAESAFKSIHEGMVAWFAKLRVQVETNSSSSTF
jgi:hypothetical protein